MNQKTASVNNQNSNQVISFSIRPAYITRWLVILVAIQTLASLAGQTIAAITGADKSTGLIALLDIDRELSIPSLFAVFLLCFVSVLLAIITILKKQEKAPHIFGWTILTLGFMFMAFDEGASIHELLMAPMRLFLPENTLSIFYFPWVIPGIIGVFVLALVYTKFLIDLPGKTRRAFILSAVMYLGGAIGVELIGGICADLFGYDSMGFNIVATAEEVFEMSGMVLFIRALADYIQEQYTTVLLQIKNSQK